MYCILGTIPWGRGGGRPIGPLDWEPLGLGPKGFRGIGDPGFQCLGGGMGERGFGLGAPGFRTQCFDPFHLWFRLVGPVANGTDGEQWLDLLGIRSGLAGGRRLDVDAVDHVSSA